MEVGFVPVLYLTQFTGDNPDDLPLSALLNSPVEGSGKYKVEDGVLTLSWPPEYGQPPVYLHAGDWMDPNGMIYSGEQVEAGYVRLSDLGSLL